MIEKIKAIIKDIRNNIGDQNDDILREYGKIDKEWLIFHYKVTITLVVLALIIEILIGYLVVHSVMLHTNIFLYWIKYLIIPSGLNFICLGIDTYLVRSKKIDQLHKIYGISIIMTIICVNLFTVHHIFITTYFLFSFAIIMTVLYANYKLTTRVSEISLMLMVSSDLLMRWDDEKTMIFESTERFTEFLTGVFYMSAICIISMVMIYYQRKKNDISLEMNIERQELRKSLKYDEMTGVYNRKALHEALTAIDGSSESTNYILAIIDIDNFKNINDRWGHHLGDECLIAFASILKKQCHLNSVFRFGGDEFCVLFEKTSIKEAEQICENIKCEINALRLIKYPDINLTASFGIAEYKKDMEISKLFIQSDNALYRAKALKNSICIFDSHSLV